MKSLSAVTVSRTFRDRSEAGKVLARSLGQYATESGVVVLGLARGGIPVARQVADALDATLGVVVSRKIGVPGIEEVALGAIAEGTRRIVTDGVAQHIGVPARLIERLATRERVELERCASLYHAARPLPDLRGCVVVLVDDGVATGVTLRAAARVVRRARPARLVAAVPIASRRGGYEVGADVDELTVVVTPEKFESVSAAYENYAPVSDDDVLELLGRPTRRASSTVRDISDRLGEGLSWADGRPHDRERTIVIPVAGGAIVADLGMPPPGIYASAMQRSGNVRGLVMLAHGDGSNRNSFRNRYIAGRLRLAGYATLRLDLLTRAEQQMGAGGASFGLDVERLATRLAGACEWAAREDVAGAQRTVLIGAGTGAAAALVTAARHPERVRAVVARGGRVDLAARALSRVSAAVLLIVGASDPGSVRRHDDALWELPADAELVKVPRAAQGFDEPGALGFAAEHVVGWLDRLDRLDRRNLRRRSRA